MLALEEQVGLPVEEQLEAAKKGERNSGYKTDISWPNAVLCCIITFTSSLDFNARGLAF